MRLREVQDHAGPAQAQLAKILIATLEQKPADTEAAVQADILIKAYLHDPYLTKNPGDRGGG